MIVLTAEQAARLDRETIARGIRDFALMQNAGDAVAEIIAGEMSCDCPHEVVVIAGKGNNGGDGFRAAFRLRELGVEPKVFLAGRKAEVKGDALICLKELEAAGVKVTALPDVKTLRRHADAILGAEVIVDALFGTGLRGEIEGLPARIVDLLNAAGVLVVAVDIPSGVNASTGEVAAHAVRADITVTFGTLKAGHVFQPGRPLCGRVRVADIGFSKEVLRSIEPLGFALAEDEVPALLPQRPWNAHKNSAGRVLVIAGSVGMTGAAALVAEAAMRSGAGIVRVACPSSLNDILEVKLTEALTVPLPEVRKRRCLSLRAMGMLRELAAQADVVVIGPGLGTFPETAELIRRFVGEFEGKVVVDADALNAFAGRPEMLASSRADRLLTPHPGELSRLLGAPSRDIAETPLDFARAAARSLNAVVLLKGPNTVIAEPSGRLFLNASGSCALATAGSGDVLAGIIAGFAAQGPGLLHAAVLGTHIHGLCGELGGRGVIARDLVERIPEVCERIESGGVR